MALAVDTTSHATPAITGTAGDTGLTWSHTCGASANKLCALFALGFAAASVPGFSATYNGITMQRQVTAFDTHFCGVQGFYLDGPATGSPLNIIVRNVGDAASYDMFAGVGISFSGATAGAPQTGTNFTGAGSANGSVTVAGSVTGDIVIGAIHSDLGPLGTTTQDQTLIFEDEDLRSDTDFNAERTDAVGANTVLSWTHSSTNWAAAAMAITSPIPFVEKPTLMGQALL